ncbi:Uncharacterised protein [Mycobacteroides abscessus subsp. abscessus]|uniref:DUF6308 family protein n=1 Tax=Mycobacteroides abscessus TaxID=36809 RepID=UPI0009284ECB|nr:DUF6308 family protein [Mycobacteroides abscessus]SHP27876.1 Uncharacterised protein [Mycobacteroides abscessus subsp. abscessus]SHP67661.1 Uncharacterised protein [Mycobacteroides abscessus subsp. abscessus]SHY38856.1 Uncharacterised protein [Mycobacteroides abscessus subsp. abscessus]SKD94466.1 Uncharacterised protein [Mycobacteroides abscessus subsp. abscessus]
MGSTHYEEWRLRWPKVIVEQRTADAVALLAEYYATDDAGVPEYSGSQFEAIAALNTDPYSIGLADFTAVSMLSVAIPGPAALRILGPDANTITELLRRIPTDCDIIDADPAELTHGAAASRLWEVLRRGHRMGKTKTSKLIAAKRPRLIPIWDSFVQEATGLDTSDNWRKFRQVLVADDHAVWSWLTDLAQSVPAGVSNLRILDVLLWMSVDKDRRRHE